MTAEDLLFLQAENLLVRFLFLMSSLLDCRFKKQQGSLLLKSLPKERSQRDLLGKEVELRVSGVSGTSPLPSPLPPQLSRLPGFL